MRLVAILCAFLLASTVGAVSYLPVLFVVEAVFSADLPIPMLTDSPFLVVSEPGILVLGILYVAILATPAALPVVVFAEVRAISQWWPFAAAGVATSAIILLFFWRPFPYLAHFGWMIEPIALIVTSLLASTSYWLIAWKLLPPVREIASV